MFNYRKFDVAKFDLLRFDVRLLLLKKDKVHSPLQRKRKWRENVDCFPIFRRNKKIAH